jgi:hypothetical protein
VSSFAVDLCLQLHWASSVLGILRVSSFAIDLCLQLDQAPNVLGNLESEFICC